VNLVCWTQGEHRKAQQSVWGPGSAACPPQRLVHDRLVGRDQVDRGVLGTIWSRDLSHVRFGADLRASGLPDRDHASYFVRPSGDNRLDGVRADRFAVNGFRTATSLI